MVIYFYCFKSKLFSFLYKKTIARMMPIAFNKAPVYAPSIKKLMVKRVDPNNCHAMIYRWRFCWQDKMLNAMATMPMTCAKISRGGIFCYLPIYIDKHIQYNIFLYHFHLFFLLFSNVIRKKLSSTKQNLNLKNLKNLNQKIKNLKIKNKIN